MGGMVSSGRDNDELIDNLVDARAVRTATIEKALRLVDRGDYYLDKHKEYAYRDMAWRCDPAEGNLHISAPCIYANVLEELQLQPGHSFLNLGSGTGYLNTVVGFLIGSGGLNHGVELHKEVVEYANECLHSLIVMGDGAVDACDFGLPQFIVGNALLLDPSLRDRYDRVYCGAGVASQFHKYVCSFSKIGGVCVLPVGDQLQRVTRTGVDTYDISDVSAVSFASLIEPTEAETAFGQIGKTLDGTVTRLRNMCRRVVRDSVREHCEKGSPLQIRYRTADFRLDTSDSGPRRRRRRPVLLIGPDLSDYEDAAPAATDDDDNDRRETNDDNERGRRNAERGRRTRTPYFRLAQRFYAAIADPSRSLAAHTAENTPQSNNVNNNNNNNNNGTAEDEGEDDADEDTDSDSESGSDLDSERDATGRDVGTNTGTISASEESNTEEHAAAQGDIQAGEEGQQDCHEVGNSDVIAVQCHENAQTEAAKEEEGEEQSEQIMYDQRTPVISSTSKSNKRTLSDSSNNSTCRQTKRQMIRKTKQRLRREARAVEEGKRLEAVRLQRESVTRLARGFNGALLQLPISDNLRQYLVHPHSINSRHQ